MLFCACALVLAPIIFWIYLQLKVVYMKREAPRKVEEKINIIPLPGKFIHQEVRDNGCASYQAGWLGGGTICVMSGERMYTVSSTDIDENLRQADSKLRALGFETDKINFHLEEDLQRFHNDPDRTLWLKYFNLKTGKSVVIIGLHKGSGYSGSAQMPPSEVFTKLQHQLSGDDKEYIYGIVTYSSYKHTKSHLFLPDF